MVPILRPVSGRFLLLMVPIFRLSVCGVVDLFVYSEAAMQIHADYEPINGDLTPRETEVLAKMAEGLSRDEMAAYFHRSRATLNTHIHHIIEKLYARNALHAVAIGIVRGIIHLERMLCLVLVVGLSTAAITPSTAYAADLLDFDITDQPLLRTGRVRVRGRGRTSRRRED